MGASGWHYKVPYDADVAAALERLRREVFASGSYSDPMDLIPDFPREAVAEHLREMAEMEGEELDQASIDRFVVGDPPASIDEALRWAMESGTHSILDIARGIRDEPDFGVITPLATDAYEQLFGTTQPTEAAVEAALMELDSLIHDRWQGVYVVAHVDGEPSSIFFVGVSGD